MRGLDHDLVAIDGKLFVHIGLVGIGLSGYALGDGLAHGGGEVFEALLDAVDGIAKLEVGVTLLQLTDLLTDGGDALLQLGVVVMLRYLAEAIEFVPDPGKARFRIAVVIGSAIDGDSIELAFLDLLPEFRVEVFTLQHLDPGSHLGIGEVFPVAGLEDVVLDYGKLRYGLHVVIDVTLAHQAMFGKVVAGLLNLFPGVIVILGIVDVGLHQGDKEPSLGS